MKKSSLPKQIISIILVIVLFGAFNLSIYALLTVRLANNFSDTSQAKMVDVSKYLPHEEKSDLVRLDSSLKLNDNLPVLDGAAALVPVYASIIECVYPKGSVTYEGKAKDGESDAQKLIDRYTKKLDELVNAKEKEIMTV